MCGWQVKLCNPLVTHGLYLSALKIYHGKVLYKFTLGLLYCVLNPKAYTAALTHLNIMSYKWQMFMIIFIHQNGRNTYKKEKNPVIIKITLTISNAEHYTDIKH